MRLILFAVYFVIAYYALRAVARWLLQSPSREERIEAGEMVLDPECRVFVLKSGAVSRRIGGESLYFCSEACAAAHEAKNKG